MRTSKRILALCLSLLLLAALLAPGGFAAQTPIRIAFIDSGISTRHIDPAKVEAGCNYVFPESDTLDRIGHGTATASLVLGAADQDVSGVFPDAIAVPLVVVDAYPSGTVKNGGPAALCRAIRDAVDRFDCQIINVSLCTAEDTAELRAAAEYVESRGVLLIAAVGNDGGDGRIYYPAAYGTVVAVGTAEGERPAAFSQRGADVLAEGLPLAAATNNNGKTPETVQGTSYSCALISGLCARMLAKYPGLTPARARDALYAMARDVLAPGFDAESGWGVLSAALDLPDTAAELPGADPAQYRKAATVRAAIEAWDRDRASLARRKNGLCKTRLRATAAESFPACSVRWIWPERRTAIPQ